MSTIATTLAGIIAAGVILSACASSTTVSEWSCPSNQPSGCFDVASGDDVALDALRAPDSGSSVSGSSTSGPFPTARVVRRTVEEMRTISDAIRASDMMQSASMTETQLPEPSTPSPLWQDDPSDADTTIQAMGNTAIPASTPLLADTAATLSPFTPLPALSSAQQVRLPEQLAEIWIGPFEDAAGHYHPVSRLFIVVAPARWERP